MNLVAHEDDCQMVTGNTTWQTSDVIIMDGKPETTVTIQHGNGFPRQCTCEPQIIKVGQDDRIGNIRF